jgi:hypothetical protein
MSGNGAGSYQKDGSSTTYEPIQMGNGGGSSSRGKNKKWLIGAVLVVVLGAIGLKVSSKTPGAATDAAVKKADLPKSKSGKLKLFDSNSESSLKTSPCGSHVRVF